MNDKELRHAIGEGLIENDVHKFYREARVKTGKKRLCPTVYREAWKMYLESVKAVKL